MTTKRSAKTHSGDVVLGAYYPGDDLSDGEGYVIPSYSLNVTSSGAGNSWVSVEDPAQGYPPNGCIRWDSKSIVPVPGHYYFGLTKLVPYSSRQTNRWYDRSFKEEPHEVVQFVDLSDQSPSEIRAALNGHGIRLTKPPMSTVAILLSEHEAVTLGQLEENSDYPNHWRIPAGEGRRNLQVKKGDFRVQSLWIGDAEVNIYVPGSTLTTERTLDWRSDEEILSDAYGYLRDDSSLSDVLTPEIWSALTSASKSAVGKRMPRPLRDRFEEMISTGRAAEIARQEIVSLISSRSEFQQDLDAKIEDALRLAKAARLMEIESEGEERRRQLEFELSNRESRLTELRTERDALTAEITENLSLLDELRHEAQKNADAFKSAFEVRLQNAESLVESLDGIIKTKAMAVVETLVTSSAESAVLRFANDLDILGSLGVNSTSAPRQGHNRRRALPSNPFPPTVTEAFSPSNIEELSSKIRVRSKRSDFAGHISDRILAALLAGLVPIVAGPVAIESLQAVASVLTNDACLIVPVTATTFEPADLLGRYDPNVDAFVPGASGLVDLLLLADEFPHPVLVVLEGVNRAPFESGSLPFFELLANPSRRSLRLAHPGSLSKDDPFAGVTNLKWPANVLLAATTVEGVATLPLGASWAPYGVLIDLTSPDLKSHSASSRSTGSETEQGSWIRSSLWQEMKATKPDSKSRDVLEEYDVKPGLIPFDLTSIVNKYLAKVNEICRHMTDGQIRVNRAGYADALLPGLVARHIEAGDLEAEIDFDPARITCRNQILIHGGIGNS